jgi:hypothetical protein
MPHDVSGSPRLCARTHAVASAFARRSSATEATASPQQGGAPPGVPQASHSIPQQHIRDRFEGPPHPHSSFPTPHTPSHTPRHPTTPPDLCSSDTTYHIPQARQTLLFKKSLWFSESRRHRTPPMGHRTVNTPMEEARPLEGLTALWYVVCGIEITDPTPAPNATSTVRVRLRVQGK